MTGNLHIVTVNNMDELIREVRRINKSVRIVAKNSKAPYLLTSSKFHLSDEQLAVVARTALEYWWGDIESYSTCKDIFPATVWEMVE